MNEEIWKGLPIQLHSKSNWDWVWELGAVESTGPVPEWTAEGIRIRWAIATNEFSKASSDLGCWKSICASIKLKPKMHSQCVQILDPGLVTGASFRQFLCGVAEWVGVDCGIQIQTNSCKETWIPWGAWNTRVQEQDKLRFQSMEYTQYRQALAGSKNIENWMIAFRHALDFGSGWICGVGQDCPSPKNFQLALPALRKKRNRWQRVIWMLLLCFAILLLLLSIWSSYIHKLHGTDSRSVYTESQISNLWSNLRLNVLQSPPKYPWVLPGFGWHKQQIAFEAQRKKELESWRNAYLTKTFAEADQCRQGLISDRPCDIDILAQLPFWGWVAGLQKQPDSILQQVLRLKQIEISPSWLQRQIWTPLPLQTEYAQLQQWYGLDAVMLRLLMRFEKEVKGDSLIMLMALQKRFPLPRLALGEQQIRVEQILAGPLPILVRERFLIQLRSHQWRLWKTAYQQALQNDVQWSPILRDSLSMELLQVVRQLGLSPDSLSNGLIDSLLYPLMQSDAKSKALQFSIDLRALTKRSWAQVWPLRCDLSASEGSLAELKRNLSAEGILGQWLQQRELESVLPYLDSITRVRWDFIAMLRDSLLWKDQRLHWNMCPPSHWIVDIQFDTLKIHFNEKQSGCQSGSLVWPLQGRDIRIHAQRGSDVFDWKARGDFAWMRFVKSFGRYHEGRGLSIQIPLTSKYFRSNIDMNWQETGSDPRRIMPCGLAIP